MLCVKNFKIYDNSSTRISCMPYYIGVHLFNQTNKWMEVYMGMDRHHYKTTSMHYTKLRLYNNHRLYKISIYSFIYSCARTSFIILLQCIYMSIIIIEVGMAPYILVIDTIWIHHNKTPFSMYSFKLVNF